MQETEQQLFIGSIPDSIADKVRNRGLKQKDIILAVKSLLDLEGNPAVTWLLVTSNGITVINGHIPEGKIRDSFQFEDMEKIRTFPTVGSSFLQVRVDGLFYEVVRFPNSQREIFERLSNELKRKLKGEDIRLEALTEPSPYFCSKCGFPLPAKASECPRCVPEGGLLIRTLALMRPYLAWVLVLLALMFTGVGLDLAPPYLTKILVDDVLTKPAENAEKPLGFLKTALKRAWENEVPRKVPETKSVFSEMLDGGWPILPVDTRVKLDMSFPKVSRIKSLPKRFKKQRPSRQKGQKLTKNKIIKYHLLPKKPKGRLKPSKPTFYEAVLKKWHSEPPEKKGGHPEWLFIIVLGLAGAALIRSTINIFIGRISAMVGTRVTYDVRGKLHAKLQSLSVDFFDRISVGSLISRMREVDYLHGFVNEASQGFLVNIFHIIAIGFMLFYLDRMLAFYVLIPIPFVIMATRFFWKWIYPRYFKFWDAHSRLGTMLNAVMSGIRLVKAFAQEGREKLRFAKVSGHLQTSNRNVDISTATFNPIMGYIFMFGGFIIWFVGGRGVQHSRVTLGTLMAFFGYIGMFYAPIQRMSMFSTWFAGFMAATQRIFEILDTESSLPAPKSPKQLKRVRGRIEFQNVTFGYDPYEPVIKDVSFAIEPGQMFGIVGKSGSGKTTLVNLLCRFYDPQHGRVLIDGMDVSSVAVEDLRRHVGLVLQEPFLFRATISENIGYGKPDATPLEIMQASKAANCHEFVMRMPISYDTRLGERGAGLSGGERQRVSIARALLCDPSILILDEATSSVDTESEQKIQEALAEVRKGRTVIAIAHRLSTLKNADKIVVIDGGEVKELGTHEELMELKGIYHKLVMIQTKLTKLED